MVVQATLDNTLGASFLGDIIAAVLYGVTCVQVYIYYTKNNDDSALMRSLVGFLWFCDSVHLALVTHSMYIYCVTNFANPLALLRPTWSLLAQVVVTVVSDFTIRCIYGRRVHRLSGGNILLDIMNIATTLAAAGGGLGFAIREIQLDSFATFLRSAQWILYLALASAALADIILAASLCFYLNRSRTGFARTDGLVHKLMLYGINNGLVTTLIALLCLITYAAMPETFVFIAFYFMLSKVFLNSLLASLNARESMRVQMSSNNVMSFRRSHRSLIGTHKSEIGTADDMELAPPLAISVETSTLKRVDTYTKDTSDTKWDGKA